jgi:hypothetical protein
MTDTSVSACHAYIAFVTGILLIVLPLAHAATFRALVAKIVRISDGDALAALPLDGTRFPVRLVGAATSHIAHRGKLSQHYHSRKWK